MQTTVDHAANQRRAFWLHLGKYIAGFSAVRGDKTKARVLLLVNKLSSGTITPQQLMAKVAECSKWKLLPSWDGQRFMLNAEFTRETRFEDVTRDNLKMLEQALNRCQREFEPKPKKPEPKPQPKKPEPPSLPAVEAPHWPPLPPLAFDPKSTPW